MSLSTRVLVFSLLATILALHPNSLLSLIRLAPESAFTRPSLHYTNKRFAMLQWMMSVTNKGLIVRIDKYFKADEEALPSILEVILQRRLAGKHEETDDDLTDDLKMQPVDGVKDQEFESDLEEMHDTDEEIDNLYNARDVIMNRMVKDEYFNMDDKKWDGIVGDAIKYGIMKDERGELEPEEAYKLLKVFEDEIVMRYVQKMEGDRPPQFDETARRDKKKEVDDPPGEGPILRWQTRAVFAPGGDAWHPKKRKVKVSVTVKELRLSKHQFHWLRELAGKQYNPGKDELTITSERHVNCMPSLCY
ncbi:uncharacterized protein Pyn_32233 [Prunus yedoensis var. nudiflora]|uniref:Small ribosomal subunit protein mS35 mitochondrial conserved domain-containing protein n=1 Tax=Prunus yedoensis var. nudiflora TaxID=2094558 RepID=A0A314UJE0_PRUYE|nr:uncharacterized protein Pyn_32233 [Prunus yedoensis var. nudiflora]